jgi:hypothetical protein
MTEKAPFFKSIHGGRNDPSPAELEILQKRAAQREFQESIQSIPNSECSQVKCKCGSCLWETKMIMFNIPMVHPKNPTGAKMNRMLNIVVCAKCNKVHPDHNDVRDPAYIANIPNELL